MNFLPRYKKEYNFPLNKFDFQTPLKAFNSWFEMATQQEKEVEPNSMCLSTVSK